MTRITSILFCLMFVCMTLHAADFYVATNGTGNGSSWALATNSLQGAITACASNSTVWVSNGTYVVNLTIGAGVTVRSKTGLPADVTLNGNASGRVVLNSASSWLIGCTVTGGYISDDHGAGIYSGSASNCIISGNTVADNYTGAAGAGAIYCTIWNSVIRDNYISGETGVGPGGYSCTYYNCLIYNNQSEGYPETGCRYYNSTITANGCSYGNPQQNSFINSICWNNTFNEDFSWGGSNYYSCGAGFTGIGSIASNPLFFSGSDFHLQAGSPCINVGTNGWWTALAGDLDGNQRIWPQNGIVDMGAYEYGSQASYFLYEVQPGALTNWVIKGTTAAAQTFDIIDGTGVEPSDYTIVTNSGATWLSVNPGSGTISNDCTNTITVNYASIALPGAYTSSLSVKTSDGVGCTQTVAVTLNVIDQSIVPANLSGATMQGSAPSSTNFAIIITNSAGFTITTNAPAAWLVVTPGAGTLTNGTNTITVSFLTNGLDVGMHTATFAVVTDIGGGLTDYVAVVATVFSRPIPAISWTNYAQTIQKGVQPAVTNLIINNSGATPRSGMRYDVTSTSAWLLATTNGACTNGEDRAITVQFGDMTTNAGSFSGTLTIQTVDTNTTTWYTPVGQVSSTMQVVVQVVIVGDPGTPTNLTAGDGTDSGGIQLNWLATATNVNHYKVWRADTNIPASATLAGTTTNLAYYDTTVNPGLKRWYWVQALNDSGGAGDFSASDSGWRFLPAPTGLTATSGTYTNRVALSWTGSLGAVTYEVWRSIYTNVGMAARLGTVSAAVTTYDDTTADIILPYYYWVRSCTPDMGNYSDLAGGYRAALLKPAGISASKGTFSSKIRVTWPAVDAATKYEIWRSTDTNVANAVRLETVTIRGYDDTQASASQVFYYYWIKAFNAQGFAGPYSELDSGWLKLATPADVATTQGTRPYSIRISWNAVENATSYEVARRLSPSLAALDQSPAESTPLAAGAPSLSAANFSIGASSSTFFDDNATFAGAAYLYGVRARNALGNSELSGEAIGWRQARQATTTTQVANDYDGDKLADVVLFNPDYGLWRILCSTLGELPVALGDATCVPVQGDYDGDGLADPMIYSAAQSYWRVMVSSAGYAPPIQAAFGGPGQLAAAADYDGDRLTDPATYQAATGMLSVMLSAGGYLPPAQMPLGGPGYVGACADYDGDGKADPGVYSASNGLLRVKLSAAGYDEAVVPLGGAGMIIVPGDFDGDGKSELTTYNEATGTLAIKLSAAEYAPVNLALGGPGYAWVVPSDYDGDGWLDPAVYSQTNGWMIMFSSLAYATVSDTFGGTNNVPFVP